MIKIIIAAYIVLYTAQLAAKELSFAVVPQQSASKLAKIWTPIIEYIALNSGIEIKFTTAPDIPTFEKRLAEGNYDIAYMNPYHFVVFNQSAGYQAISKARDKQIKGILVVAKDSNISSLSELNNATLAFPAPAAFAATILTQADLIDNHVNFTPKYVSSHDSVYLTVAKGIYPAGGGVLRTFKNVDPKIRSMLRVLSTTKGYTPHAIAAQPNINKTDLDKLQHVLTEMHKTDVGRALLATIKLTGFEKAINSDWDDIRQLELSVNLAK